MADFHATDARRIHIVVHGLVQGVCFRYYTRAKAGELGLRGWVRNNPDGTVEIVAEGVAEDVNALLAWTQEGPPAARVDSVEAEHEPARGDLPPFGITF
jgi:acylphosphatase